MHARIFHAHQYILTAVTCKFRRCIGEHVRDTSRCLPIIKKVTSKIHREYIAKVKTLVGPGPYMYKCTLYTLTSKVRIKVSKVVFTFRILSNFQTNRATPLMFDTHVHWNNTIQCMPHFLPFCP